MELLGPRLILMAIETTFLFFLHVSIELQWFQKLERFLINWKHDSSGNGNTNPSHGTRTNHTENNGSEDEDVALERKRVEKTYHNEASQEGNAILKTHNLTKIFRTQALGSLCGLGSKDKIAVNNITVGIKRGECFGWLGLNGAGKSTTFKMLTNIFLPTQGEFQISVSGKDTRCRIGYCPQVDSLDPLITVEDILWIYARLKGIAKRNISEAVNKALQELDLVCKTL